MPTSIGSNHRLIYGKGLPPNDMTVAIVNQIVRNYWFQQINHENKDLSAPTIQKFESKFAKW